MDSLKGRVAVVTGAGRGIGRAISLELARLGARVALVARTEADLQEVAREIEGDGGVALAVPADITQEAHVARMAERVLAELGSVDVLVNNAGVAFRGPVESFTLDQWNRTLAVNLTGMFLCSRAFIPVMRQKREGHIVNISSGAGKQGYAGLAAYCASKFGVIGFAQSLAAELTEDGIKVSSLLPGSVDTSFGGRTAGSKRRPGVKMLLPEDVAKAVVYLLTQSERAWTQEMNLWPFKE